MKKAAYVAFIAVFFVVCALPVALMPVLSAGSTKESAALADLPALVEEGALNADFGNEAESWLSTHFAGRSSLVTLHAQLLQAVFGTSAESQVILGRDGWLFFEPTVQDFLGTQPYTPRELYAVAAVHRLMQEYVQSQGGQYVTTVAPNKNSLYGQYMPYNMQPAIAESGLTALPAAMQAQGVRYVDLYALLKEAGAETQLYHKRDTHWNNIGALLAYNALLDALDWPHDNFAGAPYTIQPVWAGDLDELLLPAGGVPDEQAVYDVPLQTLFTYMGSANVELPRVATYSGAEGGNLLMFRDSFGNALIPFISTAFADATYLKLDPYNLTYMKPGQTVITEIVERNVRWLIGAAPVMPAPARTITVDRTQQSAACTLHTELGNDYLQVYGTLDPALVADGANVYLQVEGAGHTSYYEAFPCNEEGEGVSGYGYSARIPAEELPAEWTVLPVVQNNGENSLIVIK